MWAIPICPTFPAVIKKLLEFHRVKYELAMPELAKSYFQGQTICQELELVLILGKKPMIKFQRYEVAPGLRNYIQSYWYIQAGDQPEVLDLVPDGYPEISIALQTGNRLKVGEKAPLSYPGAGVIGQLSERTFLTLNPGDLIINIKLYPWTPKLLFKVPCWELNDAITDLEAITSVPSFRQVLRDLQSIRNIPVAIILLDQFFLKKVANLSADNSFLHFAVQQIFQSKGTLKIQSLTTKIQASRRYVEKIFKNRVGLSPKHYARLIRVKKASLLLLDDGFNGNVKEVANKLKYYDQSHFLKDFKDITRRSPTEFLQQEGNLTLDQLNVYLNQWDYS